jgi:hypothetical protein
MHRAAYMLPQKNPLFRQIPLNPRVLPLMQEVLGSDCVLSSINGMTMSEGGKAQPLHLDQPQSVPGIVLNINALYTLDDFTRANGCTRVVPFQPGPRRETARRSGRRGEEHDLPRGARRLADRLQRRHHPRRQREHDQPPAAVSPRLLLPLVGPAGSGIIPPASRPTSSRRSTTPSGGCSASTRLKSGTTPRMTRARASCAAEG